MKNKIVDVYIKKVRELNLVSDFETDKTLTKEAKDLYRKKSNQLGRDLTEKEWVELIEKLSGFAKESLVTIKNLSPEES